MSEAGSDGAREQAIDALRRGAARGLAAVLRARHPDLTFEVSLRPVQRQRWPSRAALDAEARRLKAVGDDPHPLGDGIPAAADPDHREGAAQDLAALDRA